MKSSCSFYIQGISFIILLLDFNDGYYFVLIFFVYGWPRLAYYHYLAMLSVL